MALKKMSIALEEKEIKQLDKLVEESNKHFAEVFPDQGVKTTRNHLIRVAIQEYIKGRK